MTVPVPKRNIFLPGVSKSAATLRLKDAGRRVGSPDFSSGLIQAEVIPWPWSVDEIGVAFPSGIVGLRTYSPGRSTEEADRTSGTYEDWIAVPSTLPGGYTARRRRDQNRGPLGVTRRRGNAYLVCAANNPTIDTVGSYFDPYFSINGLDPSTLGTSTSPLVPSYRGTGGTATVKVPWVPMNVSQKTLNARADISGTSPTDPIHTLIDPLPVPAGGIVGGSTFLAPHVGWRNLRLRFGMTDYTTPPPATGTYWLRGIVSHMADGTKSSLSSTSTGLGDTIDFDTGWVSHTAYSGTTNPSTALYYIDVDTGPIVPASKTLTWYTVTLMQNYNIHSLLLLGTNSFETGSSGPYIQYDSGVFASPRVDVPAWFTATGAGLIAPGGV